MGIQLSVLGGFRVLVDGVDVTDRVPPAQQAILALLAAARTPVSKADLERIVGLARSSVDPQLSKLRSALGAPRPIHRSRVPRAGYVTLDRTLVTTDVDGFVDRVAAAADARSQGREAEALAMLLLADDLWRGPPLDGVVLVDDARCETRVETLVDALLAERRRCRELAVWIWLAGSRTGLGEARLRRWAEELGDSEVCWLATTEAALEKDGHNAATAVVTRWRERGSINGDAGSTGLFATAVQLLDAEGTGRTGLPPRVAELVQRAEASRLDGEWDEAERVFLAAADEARADAGAEGEAKVALAMARLAWDPSRFDGELDARMQRLLDELPAGQRLLRARLAACLAGGIYEDGSVDVERAETYAREALELVGELDDQLTAAEVLSRARKGLLDIDPPVVQLERSRRILSLARGSDYHRSLGLLASIVDLLWLDRVDDARHETEQYREIAERTRSGFHRYHVAGLDGMWALYDGRHDDVARATARAEAFGGRFGGITVAQVVQAQRLWSAYERRDLEVLERMAPVVDAVAALNPPIPVWDVAGALLVFVLGRPDEARERLARVAEATGDLAAVPRGPLRIAALAIAAIVCADLASGGADDGLRRIARNVHRQLRDHPARGVLVGWPTFYLGAKERYVELAAGAAAGRTGRT